MNYQKIHDAIIERSRERTLSCYTEKHHIIPKCMGGGNEPNNIAVLTPEEHFLVHQLLVKIYPKNSKLAHACQAMSMTSNGRKVGAKLYGWLKRRIREAKSGPNNYWFGKEMSKERKEKISKANKGKKHSEEYKRKKSEQTKGAKNPNFGKTHSREARQKISETQTGKKRTEEEKEQMRKRMMGNQRGVGYKHSPESKARMSEQRSGEKHPLFGIGHTEESKIKMRDSAKGRSKMVTQFDGEGYLVNSFASVREAQRVTGINRQGILLVCHGKHKQAGGFRWEFAPKDK